MNRSKTQPSVFWPMIAALAMAACAGPPPPPTPSRVAPSPVVAATPSPPSPPPLARVPTERETVSFESLTFPGNLWTPLLPPAEDGAPTSVEGVLALPRGEGRVPAVVIMHGCSGVSPTELGWAERLNALGAATLVVQSFGGRGVAEMCTGRSSLSIASVLTDAYRALELLAAHPRVDPARIAILGFSFGGRTALWSSQERFRERYGAGEAVFAAHLAFYPTGCFIQLAEEERTTGAPIRIFHGAADDWTPPGQCGAYVERLRAAGLDAAISVYPDALHGFDNGHNGTFRDPNALTPRSCAFVEQGGVIVDAATGEPATLVAPCVGRGVSVGYSPVAHRRAIEDVEAFLTALFRLP
ncbi:MAG TPA: dienelactone hydrolase family protein [Chloroflexaceae bacterium]|nr:dienelactone hydrolase family protein [Chloroflexaceae bacterium]